MPFIPDPIQPNDIKSQGATPSFVPDVGQPEGFNVGRPIKVNQTLPGATPGFVPDPGQEERKSSLAAFRPASTVGNRAN